MCASELKKRHPCTTKLYNIVNLVFYRPNSKSKLIIYFRIKSRPLLLRTRLTSKDRCDKLDNNHLKNLNVKSRDAGETVGQGGRSFEKAPRTDCHNQYDITVMSY